LVAAVKTLNVHTPPQVMEELPAQGIKQFDGEVRSPLAPLFVNEFPQ
jgi:hypothetical protein